MRHSRSRCPALRKRNFCSKLLLEALEDRLAPASFTVNTTTDTGAFLTGAGTTGDLRYAIAQPNLGVAGDNLIRQLGTAPLNNGCVITSAATTTFIDGMPGSFLVTGRGYMFESGTLPAGVAFISGALDAKTGQFEGGFAYLTGTPTVFGSFPITITASSSASPIIWTQRFTLVVSGIPITATTPNQKFIAQVYLDLFNRVVDASGLSHWSGLLDQGTSRTQVMLDIEMADTLEYQKDEINRAYGLLLHRQADPSGLQTGLHMLTTTGLQAEYAFIAGSQEYQQLRGGGTVSGWLTAIYADALGRGVDPGGKINFEQPISSGQLSYQQAAAIIFRSAEYDQDLVASYYLAFLRRAADDAGQAAYVSLLQSGQSPEAVIAGILASPESYNQMHSM